MQHRTTHCHAARRCALAIGALVAMAGTGATAQAQQPPVSDVSIVRFADPPVAVYGGGRPGLRPTTPAATGRRRVDTRSAAAREYRRHLADVQARVLARAERAGPPVRVERSYRIATAGFAAKLTRAQVRALRNDPRVASVEPNVALSLQAVSRSIPPAVALGGPVAPQSAALLDLPETLWAAQGGPIAAGGAGAGIVIGVLDTGIDPVLPSFAASSAGDTVFTGDDFPEPPASFSGTCEPPAAGQPDGAAVECTNKIVGARWYQVGRDPYPGEISSPLDTNGHGTHVAGIAAGNYGVTPVIKGADQGMTALSGIAPRAQIAAYKVCPSDCPTADILAAYDDAISDGVDVINFSVGTTLRGHPNASSLARLAAVAAGIPVATSGGNAGPSPDSVGATTAAWWSLAVGSTLGGGLADSGGLAPLEVPGGPAGGYPAVAVTPRVLASGSHDLYASATFAVPGKEADARLCKSGSLAGIPAGAYIVCDRGEVTFNEKVTAVRVGGAGSSGGVVFITDDRPIIAGTTVFPEISAVMLTRADGQHLRGLLAAAAGKLSGVTMAMAPSWQPIESGVAYFGSSRGPTELMPDVLSVNVAAPGVSIPAAYATKNLTAGDNAAFLTGTSMASPHVAGVLALLRRDHPEWTADELRSALVTTGVPVSEDGWADLPATPFAVGGGRIDPAAATSAGLLISEGAGAYDAALRTLPEILGEGAPVPDLGPVRDPADLNLPYVVLRTLSGTRTVTRTVRSADSEPATWNVAAGDLPLGWSMTASPSSFTIAPGQRQDIQITLTGPATAAQMTSELVLNEVGGVRRQRLPVAARTVAAAPMVPRFDVETTAASGAFPLPPAARPASPEQALTARLGRLVLNEGIAYDPPGCPGAAETLTFDVPAGTEALLVDVRAVFLGAAASPTVTINAPSGNAAPQTAMPRLRVFEDPEPGTWTVALGRCGSGPVGAQVKAGLIGDGGVSASVAAGTPPKLEWTGLPADGDYVGYVRHGSGTDRPGQLFVVHRRPAPALATAGGAVIDVDAAIDAHDISVTGTANPGGAETWLRVEHGATPAYGDSTEPVRLGAGTEPLPIDVSLGSLAAGSVRHARVVLERRGQVVAASDDLRFAIRRPPEVDTLAATRITSTSATLRGSVDPNGWATTARLLAGSGDPPSAVLAELDAGAGDGPVPIERVLDGLTPGTAYRFRTVALRDGGVVASGPVVAFSTLPLAVDPPAVQDPPPPDARALARACATRLAGKRRAVGRISVRSQKGRLRIMVRPRRALRSVQVELRTAVPCSSRTRPLARVRRKALRGGRRTAIRMKLGRRVRPGVHVLLVKGRQGRRTHLSTAVVTVR